MRKVFQLQSLKLQKCDVWSLLLPESTEVQALPLSCGKGYIPQLTETLCLHKPLLQTPFFGNFTMADKPSL